MNDSPSEHDLAPVAEALYRGRKIEAIKPYRESHGGGLKEAKDAVEGLEARLRELTPDKFTSPARAGCLGMLLLMVPLISIGWIGLRSLLG